MANPRTRQRTRKAAPGIWAAGLLALGALLPPASDAAPGTLPRPATALPSAKKAGALLVGIDRASLSEGYVPQEISASHGEFYRYLVHWTGAWSPAHQLELRISRGTYDLDDLDFPGTLHRRVETGLVAGAYRSFAVPTGTLQAGLGYQARVMQVQNSATIPGDEPGFLFVPWQAYHGPLAMLEAEIPLAKTFSIVLRAEGSPYVFSHLADSRLPAAGYLGAYRFAPRVSMWQERFSVGYVYERTVGAAYDRSASGLFATLSLLGI